MKQIKVNEKCSGCGLCIVNSIYLEEDNEGNAQPVLGLTISVSDLETVEQIVKDCPEQALYIVETGTTTKQGKAGIKEIISNLKKECESFSVPELQWDKFESLDANEFRIESPVSVHTDAYEYKFSSLESAISAAKELFRKACYSESIYKPIIQKVLVKYKVKVLRPYYFCEDTDESAYFKYNQKIREILANAAAEISDMNGGNNRLPADWKNFSVYLSKNDSAISILEYYDKRCFTRYPIKPDKDIKTYIDAYVELDYYDEYIGEGFFGKKTKRKWAHKGIYEAIESFERDIRIDLDSFEIKEDAFDSVNRALKEFEKRAKEVFTKKIVELENLYKN